MFTAPYILGLIWRVKTDETSALPVSRCLWFALVVSAQGQEKLTAGEAKDHIGEKATVCGIVVSSHYVVRSRGYPTFLNLDEPYTRQVLTMLIWSSHRPKFGDPEAKYGNKKICVTGAIKSYRGVAEIVTSEPAQIEIQK